MEKIAERRFVNQMLLTRMLYSTSSLLKRLYETICIDENTKKFIKHNLRVWRDSIARVDGGAEVLFEFNASHSSIIAFSYLANVLQRTFNARIVVYFINRTSRQSLVIRTLRRLTRPVIPSIGKQIFSSFGVQSFISVEPTRAQIDKAARLFEKVYPSLQTKQDIENLVVDGVWIGDLIYDTYLLRYSEPTIDIQNEKFVCFLHESLETFVFWREYFETYDVKAINVTHCVYNNAIPLRIAVQNNVPAYQANATHVYRMSKENLFAYGDYKYFPDIFRKLSQREQSEGIQEARKRIELRFSGKVGVDMRYSTKSAYGEKRDQPVLRKSNKLKVLIAAHCFFDSPHSYGNNLFPDFYEWFDFLGRVSNETDYDWYIKTHPDFLPGNSEIIEYFINKYPKFTLIDAAVSHHQLIEEGISCALTTYGTIGFEYAALGVPVINASLNNPHIAYAFNLHPKNIDEYRALLMNIDRLDFKIEKTQVYEYYFMKHIFNTEDWLFSDYSLMVDEFGGYLKQFTPGVYEKWITEWTQKKHNETILSLNSFIDSGDYRMDYKHLGREYHCDYI